MTEARRFVPVRDVVDASNFGNLHLQADDTSL
jgi:hypothetical protein